MPPFLASFSEQYTIATAAAGAGNISNAALSAFQMSEVKFQFWNIKLNACYNIHTKSNQVIIYEHMT